MEDQFSVGFFGAFFLVAWDDREGREGVKPRPAGCTAWSEAGAQSVLVADIAAAGSSALRPARPRPT